MSTGGCVEVLWGTPRKGPTSNSEDHEDPLLTSLVVVRIHLPVQGTWVRAPGRGRVHNAVEATKVPVPHGLSPRAGTT